MVEVKLDFEFLFVNNITKAFHIRRYSIKVQLPVSLHPFGFRLGSGFSILYVVIP